MIEKILFNLTIVNYRNMLLLEDVLFADWLIGYCKIMLMKKVILSFIKYRLIRIRKLTKNRIYLIFKYVLYLYIKFKIKCGWY
ncbi:MAG: hypothetical protein K0S91_2066 [Nitrososphaeraceae archaeon]|nr:hypothetical protein [Nitrososphaeraceae archaeon]